MNGRADLVELDGEERKAGVREMFNRISSRYDLLNHLLSGGMDVLWRRKAVRLLQVQPGSVYLDIATGTGDYAREILSRGPARVIAFDLAPEMLVHLKRKARRWPHPERLEVVQGDAEQLPFPEGHVQGVTIGFGIRNFPDRQRALCECARVLSPGGRLVILELAGIPNPVLRALFGVYFRRVLPVIGGWISGDREAYRYLPESVARFPERPTFLAMMEQAGFTGCRCLDLSLGIASIFIGEKA
jgi:demethylmenaquinone methyltransferase/2-methoxy-6-polyprenyl-1,4-benzoquinol methylase